MLLFLVTFPDGFNSVMESFLKKSLQDVIPFQSQLHLSLSRTVPIQYHWIQPLTASLMESITNNHKRFEKKLLHKKNQQKFSNKHSQQKCKYYLIQTKLKMSAIIIIENRMLILINKSHKNRPHINFA